MADKVDTTHIRHFDGTNYLRWKFQMTLLLKTADIFDIVDGTTKKTGTNADEFNKKDVRAQTLIATTLDPVQTALVLNCTTSNEMWTKIKNAHDDRSEFTKQLVYNRFYSYKVGNNQPLVEAYTEVEQMVATLRDMGETVSDSSAVSKLVSA